MSDRCCTFSAEAGEPLYATAQDATLHLFFDWRITSWGRTFLETPGIPSAVKQVIGELAVRNQKPSARFYLDDDAPEPGCVHVRSYPDGFGWKNIPVEVLADVLRLALLEGTRTRPRRFERPAFFVCVHAAHDVCCGSSGPGVLAAAKTHVRERGFPIDVFASSHLGGHRFAATGLFFPAGISYGRMDEETIGPVLDACAAGKTYAPCLRGSVGVTEDALLAEHVLATSGIEEIRAFERYEISSEQMPHGRLLRLRTQNGPAFEVRLKRKEFPSLHCPDASPGKIVTREVIDDVVSL